METENLLIYIDTLCDHVWATGWVEHMVVYCKKCNKDCGTVYCNMPYEDQLKLVKK